MKSFITKILATMLLTGWISFAHASLIFDFEFSGGGHTVSLEILGLLDDMNGQAATSVIITGNTPSGLGLGVDFADGSFYVNSFDVSDGEIKAFSLYADIIANNIAFEISMGTTFGRYSWNVYDNNINNSVAKFDIPSLPTFVLREPSTVPEPHAAMLVILGLVGLGFSRYKKQQ
jgi:hypothetical protein